MLVSDLMNHFRQVGTWVNWDQTADHLLHGDAGQEVSGIAATWIPTNKVIRQAASKGLNLIVSHEPLFFDRDAPRGHRGTPAGERLMAEKKALLDEAGITVIRCHDVWDRMPEFGIPDAWAAWLGFETAPRPVHSFYNVCLLGLATLGQVAGHILERVRPLGQDWLLLLGDRDRQVGRLVVGTGAITPLAAMYELNVDAAVLTDDGMTTWEAGYFSADSGFPLIIVNHATAEKPGMMMMARYLKEVYPSLPIEYLDVELPWRLAQENRPG